MGVSLIYDPAFLTHDTGVHPENSDRLISIIRALERDQDLSKRLRRVQPRPALEADLLRCHSEPMILSAKALCESGETFVDIDTRVSPESFDVAVLAAGA